MSISSSSVAFTALINIAMNPVASPLSIDSSPAANQVPPSASKEYELSLDEQIEKGKRELAALLKLREQRSQQRNVDTIATNVPAVTTATPPSPTTTTTTSTTSMTPSTTTSISTPPPPPSPS